MKKIKNYIYVDISITENSQHKTGIQRVVRQFCSQLKNNNNDKFIIKFISVNKVIDVNKVDPLMNATNFVRLGIAIRNNIDSFKRIIYSLAPRRLISTIASWTTRYLKIKDIYNTTIVKEDNSTHTLLLLDANWTRDALILSKLFTQDGYKVVSVFYDLSPIIEPEFFEKGVARNFKNYWIAQFRYTDLVLSISKTITHELKKFLKESNWATKKNLEFGSIKLGCDFLPKVENIDVVRKKNKFLSVGSIEPRKNVVLILETFELLWKDNYDVSLTLVYNNTWHEESLLSRLKKHQLMNKKLFLVYDASDRELSFEYKSSSFFVSASSYEGYGLGLAEALNFGCTVFASDIPVYRELYENTVHFFKINKYALRDKIISQLNRKKELAKFRPTSWKVASNKLLRETLVSKINVKKY